MRVTLAVRERMVLTMDRDPLLARLSRRQPEDRPEKDVGGGVNLERSMRQASMQIDRRRKDGDFGQRDGDSDGEHDVHVFTLSARGHRGQLAFRLIDVAPPVY